MQFFPTRPALGYIRSCDEWSVLVVVRTTTSCSAEAEYNIVRGQVAGTMSPLGQLCGQNRRVWSGKTSSELDGDVPMLTPEIVRRLNEQRPVIGV